MVILSYLCSCFIYLSVVNASQPSIGSLLVVLIKIYGCALNFVVRAYHDGS